MSGTGNDFIFIHEKKNSSLKFVEKLVPKLCHRRNGIGADGVITIHDSDDYDFLMKYYNADGSTGSLCANGARCAILFASASRIFNGNTVNFLSNDVEYSGEILSDGNVKFNLNPPVEIKFKFKVKAANQLINANFADTGSPHVVIKIDEYNQTTLQHYHFVKEWSK